MITERSIKLLSSVMLISANRIKVWRLWLTCFEDGPIRILSFAWWMLKTRKTMVSWQAFPSLPPRAPLAFLSHLKLPFPRLPFQTPATQARLLVEKYVACQSRKSDFGWNRFRFSPCLMRKRVEKSEAILALLDSFQCISNGKPE